MNSMIHFLTNFASRILLICLVVQILSANCVNCTSTVLRVEILSSQIESWSFSNFHVSSCSPLRTRKMAMQVFHSNSFALVLGFGSLIFLVLVSLGCRFCMAWVCCRCPCHRRCGCACGRCRCGCACFQFKAAPDFQQSPRRQEECRIQQLWVLYRFVAFWGTFWDIFFSISLDDSWVNSMNCCVWKIILHFLAYCLQRCTKGGVTGLPLRRWFDLLQSARYGISEGPSQKGEGTTRRWEHTVVWKNTGGIKGGVSNMEWNGMDNVGKWLGNHFIYFPFTNR